MMSISNIPLKRSSFGGSFEPEQHTGIAAESENREVQIGVWECGPGVLNLTFCWTETAYILEGFAEIKNVKTNESFELRPGKMLLFEAGSQWTWQIPWKLKKIFTIIDREAPDVDSPS